MNVSLLLKLCYVDAGFRIDSEIAMDHFLNPFNKRPLIGADRIGVVGNPGMGPFFILYLQDEGSVISEACFECNGCGATIACGSMLTTMLENRSIEYGMQLCEGDLDHALGGLPPDKRHSLIMAIKALQNALAER